MELCPAAPRQPTSGAGRRWAALPRRDPGTHTGAVDADVTLSGRQRHHPAADDRRRSDDGRQIGRGVGRAACRGGGGLRRGRLRAHGLAPGGQTTRGGGGAATAAERRQYDVVVD